jgi:acetyl esterase/lipase
VMKEALFLALAIAAADRCPATGDLARTKVVYAQPEGHPLRAELLLPSDKGDGLRPGIVLIHGGAWFAGSGPYIIRWYENAFAEHGYVVLSIRYRKMPRHPFPCCLHDAKAAVRWLRLHAPEYRVDPNRIAAMGNSAGGHLAAFLAAAKPRDGLDGSQNAGPSSSVQAAISLYGAVDLTFYQGGPPIRFLRRTSSGYVGRFVGAEADVKGVDHAFAAASPITYASPDTAPLLFIHGTGDWVVHYNQSRAFYERLCDLGVPARLVTIPCRGHGFDYLRHGLRREIFETMLSFLDQNLRHTA